MVRRTQKTVVAASRYFIKLYGSQRRGNRPKFSHTFAVFTEQTTASGGSLTRSNSAISWLPLDGNINPLGPPEPGRNYSLEETLVWLDKAGSTMRWESPEEEIQKSLFDSATERRQELTSGKLQYVMIDTFISRPHKASNCIHAVTDLSQALSKLGMSFTGTLHGIEASRFVYHYLSPFYLQAPSVLPEQEVFFDRLQRYQVHQDVVRASLLTTLKQLTEESTPDD